MFRKKHSQINIKIPLRQYSPLSSKKSPSPLQTNNIRNLSPMKNHQIRATRTPRKHLTDDLDRNRSPHNLQNFMESRLEIQASKIERIQQNHRFPMSKIGYRMETTNDFSTGSNFNGLSKDQAMMKESKRLFTKCIAEMNSEKRKVGADRSNNTIVQSSKQVENKVPLEGQCTSFKALKIQMIESVLPPAKLPTIERKRSQCQVVYPKVEYEVKEFRVEEPVQQMQAIELFNHSFSNAGVSQVNCQSEKCKYLEGKLLESIYVQESSDFDDFDLIMQRIQINGGRKKREEVEQSVKVSVESLGGGGLTMDAFF